jgi:hypothetical protein
VFSVVSCLIVILICRELFIYEILIFLSVLKGEDTTMRFSLTPGPGEKGFQQWKDAISVATRMPGGLPPSIRQKVKKIDYIRN